ncbi:hypothetical protein AB6A40_007575 [Gnathostoma spinigerum]|uniref:Gamma interferon inducible lysosomal thiol reductase n=1 Tax=Gnathostoma spinigerum TaxID=75299 RepID=A0ABD6ENK2_9BILA
MIFWLFAFGVVVDGFVPEDFRCDRIPPSLWCANGDMATLCGWKEMCDEFKSAMGGQRLKITLLYESKCIDCQEFITEVLYPKLYTQLKDDIEITLVPFGNAHIKNGTIICQHGADECRINKFESCVIQLITGVNAPLPYINCLEKLLMQRFSFEDASAKCFRSLGITKELQTKIWDCANGKMGDSLQYEAAKITNNVYPDSHMFVPWIVVNGASLKHMQYHLGTLPYIICEWFSPEHLPQYCLRPENNRTKNCLRKNNVPSIFDLYY